MKKLTLLFAFLFTVSSSFISCRDNAEGADEVVDNEFETGEETFENEEIAQTGFGEYDNNDDGFWDEDEFGSSYEDDWSTWDADGDGGLNDDEFYDTTYGFADTNNDEGLDESEWSEGYNNLYGDYGNEEDFAEYDTNDDNILDENEWNEGWGDSDWFNDYDANDDELVDDTEWNDGFFGNWDEDNDGMWSEDEYDTYSTYNDTW